jgi:hypothetical protein
MLKLVNNINKESTIGTGEFKIYEKRMRAMNNLYM